jgi:pyruvate,orthophosphate dikinase
MQTRAIMEAACDAKRDGADPVPEIMIPLVGTVEELKQQTALVRAVASEVFAERGMDIAYKVGTMIEIPRAALLADDLAAHADFFSFGTNDLTQMTFGYSRDDVGKFLPSYVEKGILKYDPFEVIDREGVGKLVTMTVDAARSAPASIVQKCGVCGEHGGNPQSIEFFQQSGLDYVSCSPFRVLIARLAAAQAAVTDEDAAA